MNHRTAFLYLSAGITALLLSGCGHEPLPPLRYTASTPFGAEPPRIPTNVTLQAGQPIRHSYTSYAVLHGGDAMSVTSGPSTGDFNAEDQAAFVENLTRVLTERGLIQLVAPSANPASTIDVKFLKTEHFPDMEDYILDALVVAKHNGRFYERIHHVSTLDDVSLLARMFQHGVDGRRHAAELLLAAVAADLEKWFLGAENARVPASGSLLVQRRFQTCAVEVTQYLRDRYARPSTLWKAGVTVLMVRPSDTTVSIELRWSDSVVVLPPFYLVDIYAEGDATRVDIRERDPLRAAKFHVAEALNDYVGQLKP